MKKKNDNDRSDGSGAGMAEDVFAVESGTTQVSLQAIWLQEGDYQYSVEEDETVTLRNYIGTESVIVTPKEVGGKEVTKSEIPAFEKNGSSGSADIRRHC